MNITEAEVSALFIILPKNLEELRKTIETLEVVGTVKEDYNTLDNEAIHIEILDLNAIYAILKPLLHKITDELHNK